MSNRTSSAAVARQMNVERRYDRARADGEIDDGLEREEWRQLTEAALARVAGDALLDRAGEPVRLPRAPLIGKELY